MIQKPTAKMRKLCRPDDNLTALFTCVRTRVGSLITCAYTYMYAVDWFMGLIPIFRCLVGEKIYIPALLAVDLSSTADTLLFS